MTFISVQPLDDAIRKYKLETLLTMDEIAVKCGYTGFNNNQGYRLFRMKKQKYVREDTAIKIIRGIERAPHEFGL